MIRFAFTLLVIYICLGSAHAQEPRFIFDRDSTTTQSVAPKSVKKKQTISKSVNDSISGDSLSKVPAAIPAWTIDARLGQRIPMIMDTLFANYHQQALVDGQSVAMGYLGNWGSPAQNKIFIERGEGSAFSYLDAFNYCYKKPEDHVFFDTKKPYSNITYWSGGNRKSKEERFTGAMSLSFNKKFSLGFDVDYVYARGYYQSLANKQINYNIVSSYKSDNYQMHVFVGNNNFVNSENGGLKGLSSDFENTSPDALPVNMTETWNRVKGKRLYMTHKYTVGYNNQDSTTFTPVASLILTSNYVDQQRKLSSNQTQLLDDSIYNRNKELVFDTSNLNDRMAYYSVKNTFAISLHEGFRKWVKFGLTAFVEHDMSRYAMPGTVYPSLSTEKFADHTILVGGVLSKQKGEFLRYNLSTDVALLGHNLGESRLQGDLSSQINIGDKQALVKASAYIKNLKAQFFETNYMSRYYKWSEDKAVADRLQIKHSNFDDVRRVFIGGEIYLPFSQSRLSGGIETIQNYVYYSKKDTDTPISVFQNTSNMQVITARVDQKLNAGILHWDNQVVFQKSTNQEVLPLPTLSLYSNVYIQLKLAKVLNIQLGVDAHYHSKYYAQGYDPALLQFYNQKAMEIGNFPIATAYANLHLKKTRFFLMMYNVGQQFLDTEYYSVPNYLVNPMVFKFGLSWNFTD
ncbi:MAG: hypothetical protein RL662_332 [Bacteroidota bacterium]|jgi:hypothetical protein